MTPRGRVLWVNQFAATPDAGGGTRHFEFARALHPLGWSVEIAASDFHTHRRAFTERTAPYDRRVIVQEFERVPFVWLWSFPYRGNDWRRMLNWLSFAWEVAVHLGRRPKPDIIVGSSPQLFAALGAWVLARWRGARFVLEVRDLWPESLEAVSGRRGMGYWCLDRVATFLYRHADRIIVLTRGNAGAIAAKGIDPARIRYVPNGVDASRWPELDRPERGTFTAVYAGAHGPANGLDVVLSAADRLRKDPRIRFLLVGDGPAKMALQADATRRALPNVEFRPSVPKDRLPTLFAEADAGLMVLIDTPLFAFGVSPNKLFDYLAARLPVVCNVAGEVADMVRAAGAGEQARDASAEALADAVLRLAARTMAERREMGRAGREWVIAEHDRVRLAQRVAEVFGELVPG